MHDRVLFVAGPPLPARARRTRASHAVAPRMRNDVGVPSQRVGRQEQLVAEVQVAKTPVHSFAQFAKAHPGRVGAVALAAPLLVQWALNRKRKGKLKDGGAPAAPSPVTGGAAATSALKRASPRRHETRAEAFDLLGNTARKYVIVGGKGGVGKTSMSAAVATSFADRGQKTLIVSTDPAHSLSDAFGQSVGGGDPVPVLGIENLYAQEVDPESMKRTFKMMSQNGTMGQMPAGLDDMGLDDLNSLFETLPPGFDEAVALVEIIKYIEGDAAYQRFDRIVFDTAPTGHTLRLLSLPDFLDGFFGKIISMKTKFSGMMNQFKGMFGGGSEADMNASMQDMEELKRSMGRVRDLFRDEYQTEFVVATIPNMMAISESRRLLDELRKEGIPVRHVFVNQVQPENDGCTFCSARWKEHSSNMAYIQQQFDGLQISTVQAFDREIKGAGALRTMGTQLFPDNAQVPPPPPSTPSTYCDHEKETAPLKVPRAKDVPKAAAEVVE